MLLLDPSSHQLRSLLTFVVCLQSLCTGVATNWCATSDGLHRSQEHRWCGTSATHNARTERVALGTGQYWTVQSGCEGNTAGS